MKEFFVDEIHNMPFELFGKTHLVCLIFTIVVLIIIFIFRNGIRNIKKKTAGRIMVICASIMFLNVIVYYFIHFYFGIFDYTKNLPIHLCYLAGFIFIFAIVFNKKKLLKYTYFLAFVGPLPAIIWPGLESSLNSFSFYGYFFSHHFFLMSSFFSFFALKVKIDYKDVIKLFVMANLVFFAIIGFNNLFNTNYMFSNEIPAKVKNTLPFLYYFNPILVLEVMGFAITHLLYFLARKTNKEI